MFLGQKEESAPATGKKHLKHILSHYKKDLKEDGGSPWTVIEQFNSSKTAGGSLKIMLLEKNLWTWTLSHGKAEEASIITAQVLKHFQNTTLSGC